MCFVKRILWVAPGCGHSIFRASRHYVLEPNTLRPELYECAVRERGDGECRWAFVKHVTKYYRIQEAPNEKCTDCGGSLERQVPFVDDGAEESVELSEEYNDTDDDDED